MLIIDANVLIYATNTASPNYDRCHDWLEQALGGIESVGFSWLALLAFLRVSTRAPAFSKPLRVSDACDRIDLWLAQPASVLVNPDERHSASLRQLLVPLG